MTQALLIARLAALPSLSSVPQAELEWLAAHGEIQRFDRGDVLYTSASPPTGCYIVLSGQITVRVVSEGMARTVHEVRAGDISGRLPFSRMPTSAADALRALGQLASVADDAVEILFIPGPSVREMARECYNLTTLCVHHMVDRTRLFKSDDLQREKMASLGRLAAGLAHELNNPSSAAARSAKVMDACTRELVAATRALCAAGLTDDQLALVEALGAKAAAVSRGRSPVAEAEREAEVLEWLESRRLDRALAERIASLSITVADLEAAAPALPADAVPPALRYVAASGTARQLTAEIAHATERIDQLVAAVKRHTHMDQTPVAEAIDIETTLMDTLTLAESKARARTVTMVVRVEPDLPAVPGVPGQLNDVWMNLVDNAIDAAPTGGHVTVSARRETGAVVVCVTDDGPGVPTEDQARVFEPFFTTKPVSKGAGLGLDVVRRVVRSHGGAVELDSRPGHTEFRVTLPVERAPM